MEKDPLFDMIFKRKRNATLKIALMETESWFLRSDNVREDCYFTYDLL